MLGPLGCDERNYFRLCWFTEWSNRNQPQYRERHDRELYWPIVACGRSLEWKLKIKKKHRRKRKSEKMKIDERTAKLLFGRSEIFDRTVRGITLLRVGCLLCYDGVWLKFLGNGKVKSRRPSPRKISNKITNCQPTTKTNRSLLTANLCATLAELPARAFACMHFA